MSQLVTALVTVCHSSTLIPANSLIPAVYQIDDQLDHGLFIRWIALCDHQRDGHQCIVGNPLGAIFAVKGMVLFHKPEKQRCSNAFVAVYEAVVFNQEIQQMGGLLL